MTIKVILNEVDISDRILPVVKVTRQERSAALATFTYHPTTTPINPAQLIRQPVQIDWNGERIFAGKVNRAIWDLKSRTYRMELSDFWQEEFEGKTDAEILAAIPGSSYSVAVFGEREDGFQYALDLLSTVTKDCHLDRNGVLDTPDWAAKGTADLTLTEGGILNGGAYALDLTKARDIITQHKVTYEYRYNRWKSRTHSFSWSYNVKGTGVGADDWCDWAVNFGFDMPTREIVLGAANGTGWALEGSINFTAHPDSGNYCGGIVNWYITDEAQDAACIAAIWNGTRHWGQTVTEKYEIQLDVTARQVDLGMVVHEDSVARQIEADDASFESTALSAAFGAASVDPIGDKFEDQDDEALRLSDIETLVAVGVTKLWHGLRQNTVAVETEIRPTLELENTVEISTSDISAKGKVRKIEHNITLGACTTKITIAVATGGGGASDPITVPDRPSTAPTHPAPPTSTVVATYVGGCENSETFDPDWLGWTTNRSVNTCDEGQQSPEPEDIYPVGFSIAGPDIEDEARDDAEGLSQTSFSIAVPDDTLVLL